MDGNCFWFIILHSYQCNLISFIFSFNLFFSLLFSSPVVTLHSYSALTLSTPFSLHYHLKPSLLLAFLPPSIIFSLPFFFLFLSFQPYIRPLNTVNGIPALGCYLASEDFVALKEFSGALYHQVDLWWYNSNPDCL